MPGRPDYPYTTQDLAASAARTTNGNSEEFWGYGIASTLRVQLDVTAVAGTSPTLNVVIEDSIDGVNWHTVGTFAQRTAVGREVINITSPFANHLRVRWTIAGTAPSFTFAVLCASQTVGVA